MLGEFCLVLLLVTGAWKCIEIIIWGIKGLLERR